MMLSKYLSSAVVLGVTALGVVAQSGQHSVPASTIRPNPSASQPSGPGPEILLNKDFPNFTMTDINGKVWTKAQLKGKVLLVDFWATWCGPCKMASPIMQALHEKYGKNGLVVIGANCAERDQHGQITNTPEAARGYSTEHNYTYLFTYGNDDLKKAVNIHGIPTMFVVDKNGVIRFVQVGYSPTLQEILEKPIQAALASR